MFPLQATKPVFCSCLYIHLSVHEKLFTISVQQPVESKSPTVRRMIHLSENQSDASEDYNHQFMNFKINNKYINNFYFSRKIKGSIKFIFTGEFRIIASILKPIGPNLGVVATSQDSFLQHNCKGYVLSSMQVQKHVLHIQH